jgi:SAM-dependent methyltransferase
LRFGFHYSKNYFTNYTAKKKYPSFIFPPPYFVYETYALRYEKYFIDGRATAEEIVLLLSAFIDFSKDSKKLLDWGCGPGRVVRHLPELLPKTHQIFGCDYNNTYIDWCSRNINLVNFSKNNLEPPTSFTDDYFDAIYGLSIITHLSEENHFAWMLELYRILKPGGVLLITSQGDGFIEKLLPDERLLFDNGNIIIRESKNEGHRVFAAFQPAAFMRSLLNNFILLKFIPGGNKASIHGLQDTWLVQKRL